MVKKLLKSKKETAATAKVEKLNSNELKNVIGGGTTDVTPTTPPPADGVRQKCWSPAN